MKTLLAVALILAGSLCAQVERTETRSVLVDVLVADKKGNYIRDLAEKDFQVYEDGKEQAVDGLFTQGAAASSNQMAILLFDVASMTPREQLQARQVANLVVDQYAGSSMAVMNFGGSLKVVQTFTSDPTRVKQALNRAGGALLTTDPNAPANMATGGGFAATDLLRSLEGLAKNLQSSTGRKTVIFFTPGYPSNGDFERQLDKVIGAANQANVSFYPVQMRAATGFSPSLTDVSAETQPAARGRGAVPNTTLRGTAIGLNGGNADPLTGQAAAPVQIGSIIKLAEATGGFLVRQPDDVAALSKIKQEQGQFYVLSYSPPDSPEGSCHKLRVKVKRDGVNLRAREGYCKHAPGDLLSGNPVERTLEQRALAQANGNIPASIQAVAFYKAPNVARVAVAMEINPANLVFKHDKNKFLGQIDILGIANLADGAAGARFSDSVKLEFETQAQVDEFKRTAYRYENQFDIAPGQYKLAVALSSGTENFGRVETILAVDARKSDEFGLSGLVLSREFHAADATSSGLDEFLIDDHKKMVAEGSEIIPAGSVRMKTTGLAGMFVEIYEPLLTVAANPQNPLVVAVQMRILNRTTNQAAADSGLLRLDLRGKQGSAVLPLGLTLPLQSLQPGPYILEFQALDSADRNAKRTVLFEIE
ncbi:MAG: VWA domain-containing protein [Acidobacteriota bacterium]